jgi:hypothetical protein
MDDPTPPDRGPSTAQIVFAILTIAAFLALIQVGVVTLIGEWFEEWMAGRLPVP